MGLLGHIGQQGRVTIFSCVVIGRIVWAGLLSRFLGGEQSRKGMAHGSRMARMHWRFPWRPSGRSHGVWYGNFVVGTGLGLHLLADDRGCKEVMAAEQ